MTQRQDVQDPLARLARAIDRFHGDGATLAGRRAAPTPTPAQARVDHIT
jgi:hypothetical protein